MKYLLNKVLHVTSCKYFQSRKKKYLYSNFSIMVYYLFTLYNNFSNIPLKNILLTCRIVEGEGGFIDSKSQL